MWAASLLCGMVHQDCWPKMSCAFCRFAGVLGVVGIPMLVLSSVAAAGVWTGMAAVLHMVRSAHQISSIH